MTSRQCPLCGSQITRKLYERVLRLDEARSAEQARAEAALKTKVTEFETRRKAILAQATAAARKHTAQQAARDKAAAKDRHTRELQKIKTELRIERARRVREETAWKERVAQLQRKAEDRDRAHFGDDGEEALFGVLTATYAPEGDKIEHHGKSGDVLHIVVDQGTICGRIVYESKETNRFAAKYIRQLKRAMAKHDTKFGVLVCRTLPPGRPGMDFKDGVLIVEPNLAAIAGRLLRIAIVGIHRAGFSDDGKLKITAKIIEYLRSDAFANPIARILDRIVRNRQLLQRERAAHLTWWHEREESDEVISRETSSIESRIKAILASPEVQDAAPTLATDVRVDGPVSTQLTAETPSASVVLEHTFGVVAHPDDGRAPKRDPRREVTR